MNLIERAASIAVILPAMLVTGCNTMSAVSGSLKAGDAAKRNGGVIDVRYWDADKRSFTTTFFDGVRCRGKSSITPPSECVEVPSDRSINNTDTVSLRLLRAYICDFDELSGALTETDGSPWSRKPGVAKCQDDPRNLFNTRGEIAVLAKVAERSTGEGLAFQRGQLAPSDARLIYYSEDVRETGQQINIVNVPLYGPTKYDGHPLSLQLYVVELDEAESKAQRSVLSSLAKLGAAAYPPASSALDVLDKVGSAFLSGQQDDVIFDFLMEFDASSAPDTPPTADLSLPLIEGTYAFVRMEDRNVPVPWNDMELDHRSGRIKCRARAAGCQSLVVQPSILANSEEQKIAAEAVQSDRALAHTYFVVQVRRNELAGKNEGFQTFGQLLATTVGDGNSVELQSAVDAVSDGLVSGTLLDRARAEAKNLYVSGDVVRSRAQAAFAAALCAGQTLAVAAGGGSGRHAGAALPDTKTYYLLGLAEQSLSVANAIQVVPPVYITAPKLNSKTPDAARQQCSNGIDAAVKHIFG